MYRLKCSEIWSGIKNEDLDICSSGLNVSLYSKACDGGKGGDVYYFSMCSANRVTRVALADVTGHGEEVSQVSQWVYEQMAAKLDESDLPGMMTSLNGHIVRKGFKALTTAVVLSYYRDLQQVYYCYAGHPPVLARSSDGDWRELVIPANNKVGNLPFGVMDDIPYVMSDTLLAEREVLLIYSDGVLEAPAPDGDRFGRERLLATVAEAGNSEPAQLKGRIIDRLREWTGGSLDHDDVTLMAIQLDEHGCGRNGRSAV